MRRNRTAVYNAPIPIRKPIILISSPLLYTTNMMSVEECGAQTTDGIVLEETKKPSAQPSSAKDAVYAMLGR